MRIVGGTWDNFKNQILLTLAAWARYDAAMDKNPYESPKHAGSPASGPRRIALAVVLGLLTIPAMGIAFFTTCLASFAVTESDLSFFVGAIGALLAGAGMVYCIVRAAQRRPD